MLLTCFASKEWEKYDQVAHCPGPISQDPPSSEALSARYYDEVREVSMIPEASRPEPPTLIGIGPGLCGLPGISLLGTWVNRA
jgi:hypothetical protein